MQFAITIPPDQVKKLEAAIGPKATKQAMYQAVLRTTRAGTTIFKTRIREKLNLDTKYINRVIETKVQGESLESPDVRGTIIVKHELIPMVAYADRKAGKQGGVTVVMGKGKLPVYLRHAFYATVGVGKHKGIFFRAEGRDKSAGKERFIITGGRVGKRYKHGGRLTPTGYARRFPIEEKFGPSVVDAFGVDALTATGQQIIADLGATLEKNIQSQLNRFTGKSNADKPV